MELRGRRFLGCSPPSRGVSSPASATRRGFCFGRSAGINRTVVSQFEIRWNDLTHGGVGNVGTPPIPTPKEYRQHAEECLELAKEAEEFYVKTALIELADEFKEQAEKIEHQQEDASRV